MLKPTSWQLLVVDDDPTLRDQLKEFLHDFILDTGDRVTVETSDFPDAFAFLQTRRFDIVILDLREGSWTVDPIEEAGAVFLKELQGICFIPVIFYTGLPHRVEALQSVAIKVLKKGPKSLEALPGVISDIVQTKLPSVNRALTRHVEIVQRDYMWNFVVGNWDRFGETTDQASLAYLLARRLAVSLYGEGMDNFIKELGQNEGDVTGEEAHPMRYYLLPPMDSSARVGDIYKRTLENTQKFYIVLTPSCDLVQCKADFILVALCQPLSEQQEYVAVKGEKSKAKIEKLEKLMKNNRSGGQANRYFFLPSAFDIPDLVVDLQQLETITNDQLEELKRIASLDSPFVESLVARFTRYFGRVGTPDLNITTMLLRFGIGS